MKLHIENLEKKGLIIPLFKELPYVGISTTAYGNFRIRQKEGGIIAKESQAQDDKLITALHKDYFFKIYTEQGDRIIDLGADSKQNYYYRCDGLIMRRADHQGAVLLANTADCPVVTVWDEANAIIGLIHCGRAGTELNLPGQLIARLRDTYEVQPANLNALVWTGICGSCYDFPYDKFAGHAVFGKHFKRLGQTNTGYLDLGAVITSQLEATGLKHITCATNRQTGKLWCPSCTTATAVYEYPFYSLRRGGRYDTEHNIKDEAEMHAKKRNTVFAHF